KVSAAGAAPSMLRSRGQVAARAAPSNEGRIRPQVPASSLVRAKTPDPPSGREVRTRVAAAPPYGETSSEARTAVKPRRFGRGKPRQGSRRPEEAALNVLRHGIDGLRLTAGRCLAVAALVGVVALSIGVASALADAGNPITGTMKTTAVDNGDGT